MVPFPEAHRVEQFLRPLACAAARDAVDHEGRSYVVKGPDPNMVVAEAVAYCLAPTFGIVTPDFALGRFFGEAGFYFASVKLENAMRDVRPWLINPKPNLQAALSAVHVFDVWLANNDRNLGGFLMRTSERDRELVSIDFEKSHAIRGPSPLITVNEIEPKKLRPGGVLAKVALPWLNASAERLRSIPDACILDAVGRVKVAMGADFAWSESVSATLIQRRSRIDRLLEEVWK